MTDAPRIESLDQLAELCRSDTDRELWQCLAEGAALAIRGTLANIWPTPWENALQALRWTREEFYGSYSRTKANEYPTEAEREDANDAADQQILEEINLYLNHLFGRNELDELPRFEPLPNQQPLPFGDEPMPATRPETISPDSETFETIKAKGKSRPKPPTLTSTTTPAGIAALDPEAEGATSSQLTSPAAELIISPEIVRRPLDWFRLSPFDTRTSRPKEWLEELAASLKRDGQLQPCLARPDGEHIAGWTRVEAARLAGLTELDVRIVKCDDATARRLVLLENAKRRDLTEREKTAAYNALADDYGARGLTQRKLAEDLGLSESALSNNLRLRSIPTEIWARHEAGGLSTDQVRALAVHASRPKFVQAFLNYLEKGCYCKPNEQPENRHFESAFEKGIEGAFRPMQKDIYGRGCLFKPTEQEKAQLEIVKVKRPYGGEVNMAANVTLWNKLNQAAKKKAKESAKHAADPKAQKAAAKVEAQQRASRRRFLIEESWTVARGQAIAERFAKPRKQDHTAALRLRLWISQTEPYRWSIELDVLTGDEGEFIAEVCADVHKYFTGMSFAYQDLAVEDLCKWLNVDPVPHWKPTRQLLNHCTPDELQTLAEEFDLPPGTTANDLPDVMLDKWPGGYIPALFVLDAKPAKKGRK